MLSPLELAREVAKLLEDDHICYVHKLERTINSFPISSKKNPEVAEQIRLIENKILKYIKVEPMPTQKLLFIMEDFLHVAIDQDLNKELSSGLKRKNPTRNFLQILENRPDINQHWKMYKKEKYEEYVGDAFIDDYNY